MIKGKNQLVQLFLFWFLPVVLCARLHEPYHVLFEIVLSFLVVEGAVDGNYHGHGGGGDSVAGHGLGSWGQNVRRLELRGDLTSA